MITKEKLVDLAWHAADHRATVGNVISGYFIRSVARIQPMLGGTADHEIFAGGSHSAGRQVGTKHRSHAGSRLCKGQAKRRLRSRWSILP